MKKRILLRTNVMICLIILIGFLLTAILSYQANYSASLENIEQVSTLSSEGIYYQLSSVFSKPVNVSLTMANDSFLRSFLSSEEDHMYNDKYTQVIQEYLDGYQKKYNYDSVFLVSTATGRYYSFHGVDRVLIKGVEENTWYFNMLESSDDYQLNVDNDEVTNANNEITIFVNCKIKDADGAVMGVVGVGLRTDHLQGLLTGYEEQFGVNAFLIDDNGTIEISTEHTGYEQVDFFALLGLGESKQRILDWKEDGAAQSFWISGNAEQDKRDYLVSRYIPELSWHLVVERNTGQLVQQMQRQLYQNMMIIALIIIIILFVITRAIRGFNREILRLTEEHEATFRNATQQLYDNIYELNITKNCAAGESTERYFERLGMPSDMPFDKALELIAQKEVKEEFRTGYIETFTPQNVLREYKNGNTHIQYEFMISQEGSAYFWMRIDAYIYYSNEDKSIRMFTYWKNIDEEKNKELQSENDGMTQLYHKMATRQHIEEMLMAKPNGKFAFYIFDIDNFKFANDLHSHSFGDSVIIAFAAILKEHFEQGTIIGRIGGDEFAAFVPIPDERWAGAKARELSHALDILFTLENTSWKISSSIGVAIAPKDGRDFEVLYQNADTALYQTKKNGKNGYTFFS